LAVPGPFDLRHDPFSRSNSEICFELEDVALLATIRGGSELQNKHLNEFERMVRKTAAEINAIESQDEQRKRISKMAIESARQDEALKADGKEPKEFHTAVLAAMTVIDKESKDSTTDAEDLMKKLQEEVSTPCNVIPASPPPRSPDNSH